MKEIKGNVIELALSGEFDLIAHGCNCQRMMGAGIAAAIKNQWPCVAQLDRVTPNNQFGNVEFVGVSKDLIVANAYTQFYGGKFYTGDNHELIDTAIDRYKAIKSTMHKINEYAKEYSNKNNGKKLRVGLPLIGCGIAGLEWSVVKQIFEKMLLDVDLTIVHFSNEYLI